MADWKELAKKKEEWGKVSHDDPRLDDFAHAVEDRYSIPRGVVEALKNAGERTPRKGESWASSPVGAKGVMQFMDATRADYPHDVEDPFASIDAAGQYIRDLIKQNDGDVLAAIGWYNGGKKAAGRVKEGKQPPAKETQDYIKRIQTYMSERYGSNND